MLCIAVVEDDRQYEKSLREMVLTYAERRDIELQIKSFADAAVFLGQYDGSYDVVFMDIVMPGMDGMEAARRLRELDNTVPLVFVTSVAQYAIRGYEVSAMGFMVKPVRYGELELMLDRVRRLSQKRGGLTWSITENGVVKMLDIRSIQYVEVYNHDLVFHTTEGTHTAYGQLNALEKDPRFSSFAKCSSSHLVNCIWITEIGQDAVVAGGYALPLSRRRRKPFLEKTARVLGGTL